MQRKRAEGEACKVCFSFVAAVIFDLFKTWLIKTD